MGKHKNSTQIGILIEFMEKNQDIAKGFSKRDKPTVESNWKELCELLNSAGPPQKDINGWKKTWTEWKSDIKRKLAHNKAESRATGGGSFSKYQLTQTEESIVRICSISQSVEGVDGVSIGFAEGDQSGDEVQSTSAKRATTPLLVSNTPKRPRAESTGERLKKFLEEDNDRKVELNQKLDELIKIEKENASSLRRVYRAIEKGNESVTNAVIGLKNEFVCASATFEKGNVSLTNAIIELKKEFVNANTAMLKVTQDKNEVKRKQLKLEIEKFDYQKKKEN